MTKSALFTPILIAGCIVLLLNFAIRASFGVFQIPIAEEFDWARADFSLAIAIQNLAWGSASRSSAPLPKSSVTGGRSSSAR